MAGAPGFDVAMFDAVADRYDRVRPSYPAEMWSDLASITGLARGAAVLEVGCGTGQASRALLEQGWRVLAIEVGAAMAERARRNLPAADFKIAVSRFEDWDPGDRRFDLVMSATAFHWVDPAQRWSKAAGVLRSGGCLALATNQTVLGGTFPAVYDAVVDLHARYAPEMVGGQPPAAEDLIAALEARSADIGSVWGAAEPKAGPTPAGEHFAPPALRWYSWGVSYPTADAVALLSTYSPYLAIPPDRRERLLAAIGDCIEDRFGGEVSRRYLTILAVAARSG